MEELFFGSSVFLCAELGCSFDISYALTVLDGKIIEVKRCEFYEEVLIKRESLPLTWQSLALSAIAVYATDCERYNDLREALTDAAQIGAITSVSNLFPS